MTLISLAPLHNLQGLYNQSIGTLHLFSQCIGKLIVGKGRYLEVPMEMSLDLSVKHLEPKFLLKMLSLYCVMIIKNFSFLN